MDSVDLGRVVKDVGKDILDAAVVAAENAVGCRLCFTIFHTVLGGLFGGGGSSDPEPSVWDQVKDQVEDLIDDTLYQHDLDQNMEKLSTMKSKMEDEDAFDSSADNMNDKDLKVNLAANAYHYIQEHVCAFLPKDGDVAKNVFESGRVFNYAVFASMHVSAALENLRAYADKAALDEERGGESWDNVLAYHRASVDRLISFYSVKGQALYDELLDFRQGEIHGLTSKRSPCSAEQTRCTQYYQFVDNFNNGAACRQIHTGITLILSGSHAGQVREWGCLNKDAAWSLLSDFRDDYLAKKLADSEEFWRTWLIDPIAAWTGDGSEDGTLADKIYNNPEAMAQQNLPVWDGDTSYETMCSVSVADTSGFSVETGITQAFALAAVKKAIESEGNSGAAVPSPTSAPPTPPPTRPSCLQMCESATGIEGSWCACASGVRQCFDSGAKVCSANSESACTGKSFTWCDVPECTAAGSDPWASGAEVSCCEGLQSELSDWKENGAWSYRCVKDEIA